MVHAAGFAMSTAKQLCTPVDHMGDGLPWPPSKGPGKAPCCAGAVLTSCALRWPGRCVGLPAVASTVA